MLKATAVSPEHTPVLPVMAPGVAGIEVTVTAEVWALLVPQVLPAVTVTFPDVVPKLTEIEVVPCPDTMVAPDGTVHV
jgi:hypothetical protein